MPEATTKRRVTPLPDPASETPKQVSVRQIEGDKEDPMPSFIQRAQDEAEPNPQTPSLEPLDNPAMKAVFDAHNQYQRSWLKGVVDDAAWEVISRGKEDGYEIDDDLNSLEGLTGRELQLQIDVIARRAFHNFIETCHARRVQFKTNPELTQAHSAEWQSFKVLSRLAGWVLDFGED